MSWQAALLGGQEDLPGEEVSELRLHREGNHHAKVQWSFLSEGAARRKSFFCGSSTWGQNSRAAPGVYREMQSKDLGPPLTL